MGTVTRPTSIAVIVNLISNSASQRSTPPDLALCYPTGRCQGKRRLRARLARVGNFGSTLGGARAARHLPIGFARRHAVQNLHPLIAPSRQPIASADSTNGSMRLEPVAASTPLRVVAVVPRAFRR